MPGSPNSEINSLYRWNSENVSIHFLRGGGGRAFFKGKILTFNPLYRPKLQYNWRHSSETSIQHHSWPQVVWVRCNYEPILHHNWRHSSETSIQHHIWPQVVGMISSTGNLVKAYICITGIQEVEDAFWNAIFPSIFFLKTYHSSQVCLMASPDHLCFTPDVHDYEKKFKQNYFWDGHFLSPGSTNLLP